MVLIAYRRNYCAWYRLEGKETGGELFDLHRMRRGQFVETSPALTALGNILPVIVADRAQLRNRHTGGKFGGAGGA